MLAKAPPESVLAVLAVQSDDCAWFPAPLPEALLIFTPRGGVHFVRAIGEMPSGGGSELVGAAQASDMRSA